MKTKETLILHTTRSNSIGQVKKEDAQKEIERLNKQENTNSWRIDESDFMFVEDETDGRIHNPCKRREGYVWITCEPLSTRKQALAWWNNLTSFQRSYFKDLHISNERSLSTLTGREIEEIWRKETQQKSYAYVDDSHLKPNQKQFKQFDESLFKAYIDKFSDKDLHKALILIGEKLCSSGYIKDFSYSQKK